MLHQLWLLGGLFREHWVVPVAAIAAAASAGVAMGMLGRKRRLREHRLRMCLCPSCGCDLQAATDRCPECGAVPKEVAA